MTRILAATAGLVITFATPAFAGAPQTAVLDVQNMTALVPNHREEVVGGGTWAYRR